MPVYHTNLLFIEQVVSAGLWGESDFGLVDVGASGGIDPRWSVFGERLAAVGFDPLIAEIERLTAVETRRKVRYEAARVGCRTYDDLFPPALRGDAIATRFNQPFHRSSAVAVNRIQQKNYVKEVFNSGAEVAYADRLLTLDEYLAGSSLQPSFLKIDTDGSDIQVLLGASDLLRSPDLLGIEIESQFHGAVHDYGNTFANIDRYLRERGFSLFDLDAYRYSRAALPAPFAIGLPAQTVSGQVLWGEAVYFRDLAHPAYERMFSIAPTRERLLKLCCLFAMFGLDDCAAELLTTAGDLQALSERERLLDALTPAFPGMRTYREYMARFSEDPGAWLPQNIGQLMARDEPPPAAVDEQRVEADPPPQPLAGDVAGTEPSLAPSPASVPAVLPPPAAWQVPGQFGKNERLLAEVRDLRTRVAGLKKIQRKLRRQLDERNEKIKRLRTERSAAKSSHSASP